LPACWSSVLKEELESEGHAELRRFVEEERASRTVYPKPSETFRALREVPFDAVKVVIVGQDPYHGAGQALGRCFGVPCSAPAPPSLRNVLKELDYDVGGETAGDLSEWSRQGVLLLNSILTVRHGEPLSHANRGWERLTDLVCDTLVSRRPPCVFLLWGAKAKAKVPDDAPFRFEAPHPSPLSAHRGFFGSKPFSQANRALEQLHQRPINWTSTTTKATKATTKARLAIARGKKKTTKALGNLAKFDGEGSDTHEKFQGFQRSVAANVPDLNDGRGGLVDPDGLTPNQDRLVIQVVDTLVTGTAATYVRDLTTGKDILKALNRHYGYTRTADIRETTVTTPSVVAAAAAAVDETTTTTGMTTRGSSSSSPKKTPTSRTTTESERIDGRLADGRRRIDLRCPYAEKDDCKARGGRWDAGAKTWYVVVRSTDDEARVRRDFRRWLPSEEEEDDSPGAS